MSHTAWAGISLTAVASNGNLTQLYDPQGSAGTGGTTAGTEVREPIGGELHWVEVMTDGANGGTIEIWDLNGADGGADVNTATVITDAQRNTAVSTNKRGRLLWTQSFTANTASRLSQMRPIPFQRGLAARFYNSGPAGTCVISLAVDGGNRKIPISG